MAEGRAQRVSQHAGRPHGSGDRWSHLYLGGHLVSMIKPTRGVLSQVHRTGTILSLNIHSCSPTLGARNCAERCPVPRELILRRQINSWLLCKCEDNKNYNNNFHSLSAYHSHLKSAFLIPIYTALLGKHMNYNKNKCLLGLHHVLGTVLNISRALTHLTSSNHMSYYCPHFPDEETERQRD